MLKIIISVYLLCYIRKNYFSVREHCPIKSRLEVKPNQDCLSEFPKQNITSEATLCTKDPANGPGDCLVNKYLNFLVFLFFTLSFLNFMWINFLVFTSAKLLKIYLCLLVLAKFSEPIKTSKLKYLYSYIF